jgi:hypothetical protein
MLDFTNDSGHLPTLFDEDDARQPVIYRSRTGARLPKAFSIATELLQALDTLVTRRLEESIKEWYRVQECLAKDEEPLGGRWLEGGVHGDVCQWVSNAEAALAQSVHAHSRSIEELKAIYKATAPATADADAAQAALETARLRAWPTGPGATPPASYTQVSRWLADHGEDGADPAFHAFRDRIRYLIDRPHALNAKLDEIERVLDEALG